MKKTLLVLTLALGIAGCTNKKDANNALNSLGFTDVQVTGYNFLACSDNDFYHTGFRAKNPQGYWVTGTVCSGLLFKNSTVRF